MTSLDEAVGSKYDALIQSDRVHGSLYTDPEIFAEEMAKIYYTTWVYVGHESEVPEPNDYVVKPFGPQSVILSRAKDGSIHLLQNRCAHRANLVCDAPKGNSTAFRCQYHGWTYANDGELLGFPYKKGYEGADRSQLGLGKVPRVESYQGFVFGSFATEGPSLTEHLGDAAGEIDRLVRLSPTGKIKLTAGWLKHKAKANWKMLLENETDGYHPQFVHSSVFAAADSGIGALYSDNADAVSRDLGGGHTENDLRPEFRRLGNVMGWFGTTEDKVPNYVAKMRELHGEKADEILIEGSPHLMVFPNLFIAEIQIFVIQPLAVDETVQHVTAIQFEDGEEMNRRLLQQTIGSVGPAGFLLADDSEMYERNQRGVQARNPEWLVINRGANRERVDENGHLIGYNTDEVPIRAIWKHYKTLMEK
ncbi:aromatic ring-hydroxylating dioxygenase subunit alpha [Sporichthya sp.]|uniref:aromatic ring-hydroxylating oxygenase subunit alpha n=1 Tax=Sporichthya sp. TaxID=65475 RepID=UPI0017D6F5FE|nr:aromatic ring-hydroxylating dioxygenase subunit alpha [Sporichthya sp.]MBA3741885.1 Rieske 2Fe-2S domain-containing protein [Sporichthya sp.]